LDSDKFEAFSHNNSFAQLFCHQSIVRQHIILTYNYILLENKQAKMKLMPTRRMKKSAAADAAEFTTEITKRRGVLGKIGLKKKTKVPVSKDEEKADEEEPVMEPTLVQQEDAPAKAPSAEEAPAAASKSSEQLEPEAEKEEDESPMAEEEEEEHDETVDEPVEEREQDEPKEEETEEPASEEPTPMDHEESSAAHMAADESPVMEEREQPEATSPLASTGFLCGCMG
jgi:hypothetical protein